MTEKLHILLIIFSSLLLLGVLELVRSRMVREKYAIIWVLLSVSLLILAIRVDFIFYVAEIMGVHDPVNALVFIAIVTILLVLMEYSVILTRHHRHTRDLLKKYSLLQLRLEELERRSFREREANAEPISSSSSKEDLKPSESIAELL